jgi:hypothetical protein
MLAALFYYVRITLPYKDSEIPSVTVSRGGGDCVIFESF